MKRFMLLLVILVIIFFIWQRQRLYLRDPFGSVMRDGMKERGAQVYINHADDVLLENYNAPMYVTLVQHRQLAGTPAALHCLAYVACLLAADVEPLLEGDEGTKVQSMSSKTVEFRDAQARDVVVTLR